MAPAAKTDNASDELVSAAGATVSMRIEDKLACMMVGLVVVVKGERAEDVADEFRLTANLTFISHCSTPDPHREALEDNLEVSKEASSAK